MQIVERRIGGIGGGGEDCQIKAARMNTAKPLTRLTFSCARRSRGEHGLPILADISAQSHAHSNAEACKADAKWGHVHTPPLKSPGKSAAHAQRRPTCTEKAKPRQRVARIREWPFILHSPKHAQLLRNQRQSSRAGPATTLEFAGTAWREQRARERQGLGGEATVQNFWRMELCCPTFTYPRCGARVGTDSGAPLPI